MAEHINSAYRVKDIINSVKNNPDKSPAYDVWSKVFSIEEQNQERKIFKISRCLGDLHDEVELIRSEMIKLGYSQNLYSPSLNKCNAFFSVSGITGQWGTLKRQMTEEINVALGFCSEILPNEEDLVDQGSLDELKKMATDLRNILEESTLPPYTKHIIEKHLSKIEEAISSYKVVGAKVLDDVMQSAYGVVISNEAIFAESKDSHALSKLKAIWQKTQNILDGVVSANRRISGVQGMTEKGQEAVNFLQDFMS